MLCVGLVVRFVGSAGLSSFHGGMPRIGFQLRSEFLLHPLSGRHGSLHCFNVVER